MPPYTDKVVSNQEVADIHAYLRFAAISCGGRDDSTPAG